jgi:hypothetical protein
MKSTLTLTKILLLLMIALSGCEPVETFERNTYQVNENWFSLRAYPEWTELGVEDIPWGKAFKDMDPNRQGFIAYYFRDTIGLSLRNSNIRVEYFSRNLPNCSNNDSVSMYMEKIMTQKYGGLKTFRDTAAFKTQDDKNVAWVEAVSSLNGIWFAWAYIPLENYYLAMNLSAFSENDFQLMKEKFRNMAASFQEEEEIEEAP